VIIYKNFKTAKVPDVSLKKILLAILSGVMLSAAFPPGRLEWMAWIAIIPLLKSLENQRPLNAFRLGMIAGLSHYLTLLYWVIFAVNTYGGLDLLTSTGILFLLCLYLSLYPAVFSVLINFLRLRKYIVLITAGIWVSLEYARAELITGFPWCLLGYSQFNFHHLIQICDITGVYGVSFLIAAINVLIYLLIFNKVSMIGRRDLIVEAATAIPILLICLIYGGYCLSDVNKGQKGKEYLKIAVIQGNIDQSVKWDPVYKEETMKKYMALTKSALNSKPGLVVWPETSTPFFFQDEKEFDEDIYRVSKESGAYLIFGSLAYKTEYIWTYYYNRAYMASPDGSIGGYYDKVHLVPFVEYVPLKYVFPFIHRLVTAAGDFSFGEESGLLKMTDTTAGALICYEAIFPDLARMEVKNGADFFVTMTNDAWFDMTSAPYQLMSMSIFRAVENRRPLIRAANTGFSAFVDAYGRVIAESDLFTEDVLIRDVRTDYDRLTFYSKYGDVFIYLILIICLIKISRELWYHLKKNKRYQ